MRFTPRAFVSRCGKTLLIDSYHASATLLYFLTLSPKKVLLPSSLCVPWSINTAEFNRRPVCPSTRSLYVQVLTVCYTQLCESIMKPVICEWHLSLWDSQFAVSHREAPHYQDSGCIVLRQRGWRGHIEATHKMERVLKFHVWQQQTE